MSTATSLLDKLKVFFSHKMVKCDAYASVLKSAQIPKEFEGLLLNAKGTIIIMLLLVSAIYQIFYHNIHGASTLLNTGSGRLTLLYDILCTSMFGVLSAMFVIWSRSGTSALFKPSSFAVYGIVAFILGLFCFSEEASGFNRYLDRQDILNHQGIYYNLDNNPLNPANTNPSGYYDPESTDVLESGGDPFTMSMSYFFMIIVIGFVLYQVAGMIKVAVCGYTSGAFPIGKILNGLISSSTIGFIIEILIVGILNAIPPLVSPIIKKQQSTLNSKSVGTAGIIMIIVMLLQTLFQFSGMLK